LRMAQQNIPTQACWAATDSVLMGRRVPAPDDVTVATPASSQAAVAMDSTAVPGATRAGTAESLATVVTQRRGAPNQRTVVVVQADARVDSVQAVQVAMVSTGAEVRHLSIAAATAATADCSAETVAGVERAALLRNPAMKAATAAWAEPAAHWPAMVASVGKVDLVATVPMG